MKLNCPNLLNPLDTIIQENYQPFNPSEPFRITRFKMRHPVPTSFLKQKWGFSYNKGCKLLSEAIFENFRYSLLAIKGQRRIRPCQTNLCQYHWETSKKHYHFCWWWNEFAHFNSSQDTQGTKKFWLHCKGRRNVFVLWNTSSHWSKQGRYIKSQLAFSVK